ncbi:tRNA(Met) cytidine acetyltransferase TmcA [Ketobacter sp.]|uniref:tRNA(Met) cytidine acetyltransferase TmcA n=1 Tax=Ketobacter sp. TaxID=2083498 RepID=UPI000F192F99|nr:GNAT family N-acetyltransferase [Ketobacter sp.]RLT98032.1 MAG: tRNA(Met) cytidine acetyltransferase [Ketobacter sp.]
MDPLLLPRLQQLQESLRHSDRRLLVLVEGSADWTLSTVQGCLQGLQARTPLWYSTRAPESAWRLSPDKINHELGREADHGVFDVYSGLQADALAAISGNIRGGGMLWMLCPPLHQWHELEDGLRDRIAVQPWGVAAVKTDYARRLAWIFQQQLKHQPPPGNPKVARITEDEGFFLPELPAATVPQRSPDDWGCVTQCQRQAVEAVLHVLSGHRKRPLVIEADRGRGKSAAMGIAVQRLLQQGRRIVVTAPRPESAETILRFARLSEPPADHHNEEPRNEAPRSTGSLEFVAPDRLLSARPAADLLLVDEAAAIAPDMLKAMLRHYARAVFATTVNGYEGTGRGFAVRFQRFLDAQYPGWVKMSLQQPVRWQGGDWLEQSLNRALLLQPAALPTTPDNATAAPAFSEFRFQCDEASEACLNQMFELLMTAHYRTRPSDLRTMLDGSNVRLFTLTQADRVLAVAMVAAEGELSGELAQAIVQGRRRPHGQVLPQTLAVHLGQEAALGQTHWRVVRIAVQPDLQQQGLGSTLLQHLVRTALAQQVDCIGSLFSGSPAVLAFWQRNGCLPLRVGYTREATTGDHSLLVLQGLSEPGRRVQQAALDCFNADFPLLLQGSHRLLPADLVVGLMADAPASGIRYHERDQIGLQRYLANWTPLENVAPSLWRLLWGRYAANGRSPALDITGRRLLVMKVLQNHTWQDCIDALGLSGIKAARSCLRQAVEQWTQVSCSPTDTTTPANSTSPANSIDNTAEGE